MNEQDGQADVQQDHHADEDGVGDLGTAETGCLSPQESTLPHPNPPQCPAPGQTIRAGRIPGGNNQPNCSGSREIENVSQDTQRAELGLESKYTAVPTANSSGAASLRPSEPSFSLWHCSFLLP